MGLSITELTNHVAALPPDIRQVFDRIFSVDEVKGELKLPQSMLPWVEHQFGSVDNIVRQRIVKVTNRITFESSIFNPLRALRPHRFQRKKRMHLEGSFEIKDDHFADPIHNTPEDPFGRIKGKYCITAGNVAKYEGLHGVIVFDDPDPLKYGCSQVADYLETGWRWSLQAHAYDPEARYFLFLWNCNFRAGASIPHGHAQVVLGRHAHYGKVEQLHRAASAYRDQFKVDYFEDIFRVHEALGLGLQLDHTRIMAYLTPLKLNEIMALAPALTDSLKEDVYHVLACFRSLMQVTAFNVGIAFPPLGQTTGWEGFPVIARMVDRGNSYDISSDIGAMEFFGANVVNSDPFRTADVLFEYIRRDKKP
ncbi:MAG: hypothetical protein PHO26_07540 [Dehalococcoidia bacterium]|nr:hypothetical protein [Dehalococcoidia bacterium]MDD5494329.1 hypothetical protein [Dehalococcoidia bacterium]